MYAGKQKFTPCFIFFLRLFTAQNAVKRGTNLYSQVWVWTVAILERASQALLVGMGQSAYLLMDAAHNAFLSRAGGWRLRGFRPKPVKAFYSPIFRLRAWTR